MIIHEYRGQKVCFNTAENSVRGDDGLTRFYDQNGTEVGVHPHEVVVEPVVEEEPKKESENILHKIGHEVKEVAVTAVETVADIALGPSFGGRE